MGPRAASTPGSPAAWLSRGGASSGQPAHYADIVGACPQPNAMYRDALDATRSKLLAARPGARRGGRPPLSPFTRYIELQARWLRRSYSTTSGTTEAPRRHRSPGIPRRHHCRSRQRASSPLSAQEVASCTRSAPGRPLSPPLSPPLSSPLSVQEEASCTRWVEGKGRRRWRR